MADDEKLAKDTDANLAKAGDLLGDLEKRLNAASNGITAPDKLAALARIKRKLADSKGAKDKLAGDAKRENTELGASKGALGALKPETPVNDLIDSLGEIESGVNPLDENIKETNASAGDLLKSLADLNAELDDFNKNGRLGVLKGVQDKLKNKLAQLDAIDKRLKELEAGIVDTQK